jgi:hypothetical protein
MVAEGNNERRPETAQTETVQPSSHHGKMISPTKEANMINVETVNAMDIETLKATLLSVLAGDLKVKDGVLVAPLPSGPRGPTAKVAPRLEACKALMVQMASSGVTAKELLEAGGGQFLYTDVLLVARNLLEAGVITENRHGRKATWNLTTTG